MSSQADKALVTRDVALPGLRALLDAGSLAREAGLEGLQAAYLRYKPGTSCTAGLVPERDGLEAWMAITAKNDRFSELAKRPKWRKLGTITLPILPALLVPLAADRELPAARRLVDPDRRARLLTKLGLADARLTVLRYKPGRRVVLRADGPEGPRAVVKLHGLTSDWKAARAGARFCEAAGGPAVIGISKRNRAIAVSWAAGNELDAHASAQSFRLAGLALAAAHARPACETLRRFRPPDSRTAIRAIEALDPHLGAFARGLSLPELPDCVTCPIHGDFSADQVVVGRDGASIVDWDRAAIGPPARDLGSALARLDLDGIRGTDVTEAAEALFEGYVSLRPLPPAEDIAAHRAHALLALSTDGFRARRSGWDVEIRTILDQIATPGPVPVPSASHLPIAGLEQMLNPEKLRTVFALPPHAPLGFAPTRLKPGRRAMVRVELPDNTTVLGKIRARGADETAPSIQRGLYAAGLDGRSGVAVPEVIRTPKVFPAWFQKAVQGAPLGDLLSTSAGIHAVWRAGRAIGVFHGTPPQSDRCWTRDDERVVLEKAVMGGPNAQLGDLARNRLAGLENTPDVGLHRDFYYDQVLVSDQTVWLVDLDLHARGDPAIDLGNFLAHLTELALRCNHPLNWSEQLGQAFLEGYASVRQLPSIDRIDAFHWVSLARHVAIAKRFAERQHTISAIATLCSQRLANHPAKDEA
jgi:Ser/Thr protein kinase RdoA (MazF antagonist)